MKTQVLAALSALVFATTAHAVPTLQLDISNGVYNGSSETVTNSTDPFNLYALVKTDSLIGRTYYLSIAIVPQQSSGSTLPGFGSFKVDGTTYTAGSGWTYGVPPVSSSIANIPQHDIFPTLYIERSFSLLEGFADEYDSMTDPGGFELWDGGKKLAYKDFLIDTSNLGAGYSIHFDLYTYNTGDSRVDAFAPFSHDAQSTRQVPDGGATVVLLGTVFAGIGIIRRYLKA